MQSVIDKLLMDLKVDIVVVLAKILIKMQTRK